MSSTPPHTITVYQTAYGPTWQEARSGSVWHLLLHDARYPSALRSQPPRVRLLEDSKGHLGTLCELLDPWPDAPPAWPIGPKPRKGKST